MNQNQNNFLSEIPLEWVKTSGKGVSIGVIDTNMDANLCQNIKEHKLFGFNKNLTHGKSVVDVIVNRKVKGLAYESDLYFAGMETTQSIDYDYLKDALSWISKFDLDVLNLSFAYKDDEPDIRALLQEISQKTLIVCSYADSLSYPAKYDFTISVGSKDMDEADIITDGEFTDGILKLQGTSFSSAFIASLACLAKSFEKTITRDIFLVRICGAVKRDLIKRKYNRQTNIRL